MLRNLVLFLLLCLNFSSLLANDLLKNQIKTFNAEVKKVGVPNYNTQCAQDTETLYPTSTVYSARNKKSVELSVLTPEFASEVFNILKDDVDNSFNYPFDGCYARAHKMAMMMDDLGIISGKAFAEGIFHVETKVGQIDWSYHVASLVLVKKNGKLIPTVMDPSLFDQPVSFEEWKKALTKKPSSSIKSEYFTRRFNYDPESRHTTLTEYNPEEVEDMKTSIRQYSRMAEMMELVNQMEKK